MRKISLFLIAALVCICFAGCRSNMEVGPTDTNPPLTQPMTTPPQTTVPDTSKDVPNIPDPTVDDNTLQDLIPGDSTSPTR